MIAATHTLIFSEDAEATRAFLRDVLGFESVDAGEGWLIFALPPGELGVHPGENRGVPGVHSELYFMCHDINRVIDELEAKGVEFVKPVADEGFGWMTRFRIPGAGEVGLYEPKHASPLAEFA